MSRLLLLITLNTMMAYVPAPAKAAIAGEPATDAVAATRIEYYSGIECLQNASALLQQPLDMVELFNLPASTTPGRSITQLLAGTANALGLNAVILDRIATDQIVRCPYPVMLHVKGGRYSAGPDYYVLCRGIRDGKVAIFSPPSRELVVSLSELEEDRRGDAIILSREPLPADPGFLHPVVPFSTYGLMAGVVTSLGVCVITRRRRTIEGGPRRPGGPAMESSAQLIGIFLTSIMLTCVGRTAAGHSLFPPSQGLAEEPVDFLMPATVVGERSAVNVPEISGEAALRAVRGDALFVDARDPLEYDAGHIRGAVLCPATDISRWHLHLAGIDPHRRIIVYCAEASCHKGEYVAKFLLNNGFFDVSLYRDGWVKWTGPREAQ